VNRKHENVWGWGERESLLAFLGVCGGMGAALVCASILNASLSGFWVAGSMPGAFAGTASGLAIQTISRRTAAPAAMLGGALAGALTMYLLLGFHGPGQDETEWQTNHPCSKAGPLPEILLIEKDKSLLQLLRQALEEAGFAVCGTSCGEEAVALFREQGGSIELVITELSLPGMNGLETLARLREIDRGIPFCLMTSAAGQARAAALQGLSPLRIFLKPFFIADFLAAVTEMLRPNQNSFPGSKELAFWTFTSKNTKG
jgi:CheY-like chemotaxis protein